MHTHLTNCPQAPRNGELNNILSSTRPSPVHSVGQSARSAPRELNETNASNNNPSGSHQLVRSQDIATAEDNQNLDRAFARAVHQTGTPFHFFDHKAWHVFFSKVKPTWKVPLPAELADHLLDSEYKIVMETTRDTLRKAEGGTLSIVTFSCNTNLLPTLINDVIIHTPRPFFIESLPSDLTHGSTQYAVENIRATMKRISDMLGVRGIMSFISRSSPPMRAVRQSMLDKGLVRWAYGCASDCLNNICEHIGRHCFRSTLQNVLFVCKTIRGSQSIRRLYEKVCVEKLDRVYDLVLFSKNRWSSVSIMLRRLLLAKGALIHLVPSIYMEQSTLSLDPPFNIPPSLTNLLASQEFWDSVMQMYLCLEPLFKCISACESESAAMSTAYACLIYARIRINQKELVGNFGDVLDATFLDLCQSILSPVHCLAFCCDPYFADMRRQVANKCIDRFIDLGGIPLVEQCHLSFRHLAENDQHRNTLMGEFLEYTVNPEPLLRELSHWHPRLIWGQMKDRYPALSELLCRVFRAPASTVGVRRCNMSKPMLSPDWPRMGDSNMDRQLAIAHNSEKVRLPIIGQRSSDFAQTVAQVCNDSVQSDESITLAINEGMLDLDLEYCLDDATFELERAIYEATDSTGITEDIMFNT